MFIVGLLLVVVLWLPRIVAEHDIGQAKFGKLNGTQLGAAVNSIRTTLLQGLAGLALVIGGFFTARQLRISKEGQVTDRYTKAIDQLGNREALEVRIGGIYALERIGKDSEKDRRTIVEVLAAFVRQHAPLPGGIPQTDEPRQVANPAADVQTAISVLGRLPAPEGIIDLSLTDLTGANLAGANLTGVNLAGTRLVDAELAGAKLVGANLDGAKLRGANLNSATITRAILTGADLTGTILTRADLTGSNLFRADLTAAKFTYAVVNRAILDDAIKADLSDAIGTPRTNDIGSGPWPGNWGGFFRR
jgi:hypothetical protein